MTIETMATAERQRIVDDLVGLYERRVSSRKGKRPNAADTVIYAVI